MEYAKVTFEIGVPISTQYDAHNYEMSAALYVGGFMTEIGLLVTRSTVQHVRRGVTASNHAGMVMMEVTVAGPERDMFRIQQMLNDRTGR